MSAQVTIAASHEGGGGIGFEFSGELLGFFLDIAVFFLGFLLEIFFLIAGAGN